MRIKVIKALYTHFCAGGTPFAVSEKTLMHSIAKSYDLYLLLLRIIVDVNDYAEKATAIRKNKLVPTYEDLHPNMKFIENGVIALIRNSESLNKNLESKGLSWAHRSELIKKLYQNLTRRSYYEDYMADPNRSFNDDKELVTQFYCRELEGFDYFYEVLEEDSIYWMDEMEFELSQAIKTIGGIRKEKNDIPLMPLYKDQNDQQFVKELFGKSLLRYDESLRYIEQFISNWDMERVAFMDKIILVTAYTELMEFPTIPVKVTLDEYIEISKYFSTRNSSFFVNGILDKIVGDLKANEKLQKLGRGLVEK